MRNRNTSILVRVISILFLSATIILVIVSLINYSRQRNNYPAGMTIAGIPVGGLTLQEASERVLLVYTTPVEAQYGDSIIHIDPSAVGFELDTEAMVAAADLSRTSGSFWGGFWNYLWNQEPPQNEPLVPGTSIHYYSFACNDFRRNFTELFAKRNRFPL